MKGMSRRARQVTLLFHQLPWYSALRLGTSEILRRTLDRHAIVTYSQAGEDRLIEQILFQFADHCATDFYVDVGANDPYVKSNTLRLYLRGWHGLAIDGNHALTVRYQRSRPRDHVVHAVLSREPDDVVFAISEDPALSRIVHSSGGISASSHSKSSVVRTTTLGTLFEKYSVPSRFGLLNIDVEGADFDVLRSFDISLHRPRLIVIEMHHFKIGMSAEDPIAGYLADHEYEMIAYAGRNGFFLDCYAGGSVDH